MKPFPAEAISHSRVLVVGDVMLDRYWFGEVERISPEAPVPVVRVARREDRLGGAANVARNVAALGGRVTLVGVLGADEAGDSIRRLSAEAGIQADLIDPLPGGFVMRVSGAPAGTGIGDAGIAGEGLQLHQERGRLPHDGGRQRRGGRVAPEHRRVVVGRHAYTA